MIIDSHAHIGKTWLGWPNAYTNMDDFIREYDKQEVDKICISSWQMIYDANAANRDVFEATKRYPKRLIGFGGISPQIGKKEVVEQISRCIEEYGMKGIKINPSEGRFYSDSWLMEPVMDQAIKYNVPILLHCSEDSYSNPSLVKEIVERLPNIKLLIAHIGGEHWLKAIAIAEKYKNVYVDTTGCSPQQWVIPMAIERCGEDKIVWGSDFPALNLASELCKITAGKIEDRVKNKILYENIAKILGI